MASVVAAPRRKSDKIWRDALTRALARKGSEGGVIAGLDAIADQVVTAAVNGDKDAWKEIGDRMDGKPKQQTELTAGEDADGNPIPVGIAVELVRPKAQG